MKWLRDLARDQPCQIRVPGYCSGKRDETVLCHVRMVELPFFEGHKVHDLLGAHGCMTCHAIVDGHLHPFAFSKEERRLMLLEGVMRTQAALLKDQKIIITQGDEP